MPTRLQHLFLCGSSEIRAAARTAAGQRSVWLSVARGRIQVRHRHACAGTGRGSWHRTAQLKGSGAQYQLCIHNGVFRSAGLTNPDGSVKVPTTRRGRPRRSPTGAATGMDHRVGKWTYASDRAYGDWKTLVKSGKADAHGNLVVHYKLTCSTTFSAVFAGDQRYAPATATASVGVHAKVTDSLRLYYRSTHIGGHLYRVYAREFDSAPQFTATVAPAHPGQCLYVTLQRLHSDGRWHTVSTYACQSGTVVDNLNTYGAWQYLTIVQRPS